MKIRDSIATSTDYVEVAQPSYGNLIHVVVVDSPDEATVLLSAKRARRLAKALRAAARNIDAKR